MKVEDVDVTVAAIAGAIGEPARARMLYCLLDGRARTSTELAALAEVTPSTASVHLQRLRDRRLVQVVAQGRHRYYSLDRPEVAAALEALSVVAGRERPQPGTRTPHALRAARICYDHIAGALGVALFDRCIALGWLSPPAADQSCELAPAGHGAFERLGIDVEAARRSRRRFAFACLDWSERRPHLAGALGAAVLRAALHRRWLHRDLDSRVLRITSLGRRELLTRLGVELPAGR
jgi:DNA-binding transcriptional ArsR family regulator